MGGVINIVTAPADAPDARGEAAVRQPQQPEGRLLRQRRLGQASASRSTAARSTPTASRSSSPSERGRVDTKATVEFSNVNVEARLRPDRPRAGVRPRRLLQRGSRQRQGQHDRRDRGGQRHARGRRPAAACASGCRTEQPAGDASSPTSTTFHSNFLAVPAATPPRSIGRLTLESDRADRRRRRHGAVVAARSATRHVFTAGTDCRWVDGDSQRGRPRRARPVHPRSRCTASRAARSAASGAFVQDVITPTAEPDADAQRARRQLAQLRRAQPRDELCRPGRRPRTTTRSLPGPRRHGRQPARRRAVSRHRAGVSVWGDLGSGFRAPTLNELYRQFRVGTVLTLANDQLGPERLRRRRSRRQRDRAAVQPHVAHDVVRQSRRESGVERHDRDRRHQRHAAAAEPRAHAHLRASDRRRLPDWLVVAPVRRRICSTGARCTSSPRIRRSSATICRRCPSTAARSRSPTRTALRQRRRRIRGRRAQFDDDLNERSRAGSDDAGFARLRAAGIHRFTAVRP